MFLGRVDAGRVVSTWLHQHDSVVGECLDVLEQTVEVQLDILGVILALAVTHPVHISKHLGVVSPSGVAHSNFVQFQLLLQHLSCNFDSSTACDRLNRTDAVKLGLFEIAEEELSSCILEFLISILRRVLEVFKTLDYQFLRLADDGEDLRFARVVPLGSNAQVDFVGVL